MKCGRKLNIFQDKSNYLNQSLNDKKEKVTNSFRMGGGLIPSSFVYITAMENVANPHSDQIVNGTFNPVLL